VTDIQELFRDAWSAARAQRRELEATLDEAVRKTAGRLGFPSRDDVAALGRRLDVLSDRLAELERRSEREAG